MEFPGISHRKTMDFIRPVDGGTRVDQRREISRDRIQVPRELRRHRRFAAASASSLRSPFIIMMCAASGCPLKRWAATERPLVVLST